MLLSLGLVRLLREQIAHALTVWVGARLRHQFACQFLFVGELALDRDGLGHHRRLCELPEALEQCLFADLAETIKLIALVKLLGFQDKAVVGQDSAFVIL